MKTTAISPSQKLAEALAHEAPEAKLAKAIGDALAADLVNRDGTRGPDHKTRLSAAALALSQTVGLPVQRTESIVANVDADSAAGLEERLRHSPALRALFRRILTEAERGATIEE